MIKKENLQKLNIDLANRPLIKRENTRNQTHEDKTLREKFIQEIKEKIDNKQANTVIRSSKVANIYNSMRPTRREKYDNLESATIEEFKWVNIFDAMRSAMRSQESISYHYGLTDINRYDEIENWLLNTQLDYADINSQKLTLFEISVLAETYPNAIGALQKRNYSSPLSLYTVYRVAEAISTPEHQVDIEDMLGLTLPLQPMLELRFREICEKRDITEDILTREFPDVEIFTLRPLYEYSLVGELRSTTLISICKSLNVSLEYMLKRTEFNIPNSTYEAVEIEIDNDGEKRYIPKTRLYELLKERNMRQSDITKKLDLPNNRLSRMKGMGGQPISLDLALKICTELDVALDYFYKLTPLDVRRPEEEWPKYLPTSCHADNDGNIPVMVKAKKKPYYKWELLNSSQIIDI